MKISIVIPAYNEELYLGECLSSIEKNLNHDQIEIIVVDNGSLDKTADIAKQFPFVTVLSEPKKGVNYARQKGLAHTSGNVVAFIDADTRIPKEWMKIITEEFLKNKNLVALSGPCIYYDLKSFESFIVWIYFNVIVYPFYKITNSVVLSGNLAVKKDAIMDIGGFDTNISFYGDDTNIARRLQKVGKILFRKDFFLYTSGRRLKKEGVIKTGFVYIINHLSEKFFHKQITKKYLDIR